jgi:hypothetical protein
MSVTYPRILTIRDFFDLSGCTPKQVAALKRRVKPEIVITRWRRKQTQDAVDAFAKRHGHLFSYQIREAIRNSSSVNFAWYWEKTAILDLKKAAIKCLNRYGVEPKPIIP